MSTDEVTIQKLVAKAASLLKKAPMLTVPQATNFSSEQSTNPALQMRVRRMMLLSKKQGDITSFPMEMNVDISLPMPTVSTLASPPIAAAAAASLSATTSSVSNTLVSSTTSSTTSFNQQ